jgi:hypothetical protein
MEMTDKDHRGIPVVKETTEADSKAKRDAAKAEALAKAKAIVEAQSKKTGDDETGEEAKQANIEAIADIITGDADGTASKKRAREDDEGDAERELKKVDTKTEVEVES